MSKLKRFSISLDDDLVTKFDKEIGEKNYPTRSKAIGDLIREYFVKKEWIEGKEVAGTITLVYNHHKRELVNKLTDIQHDFHDLIVSSQHVHLDHDNCLEIVVTKGKPKEIEKLTYRLKSTKGVKHGSLTMTTTGKEI
ncbi:MAG: nickel-responsive transcriptional regulator NikR [Elusimicrobiota bacterium]